MATHSNILVWRIPWTEEQPIAHGAAESCTTSFFFLASQVVLVVKNSPTNAGDAGDMGSIPGLGRYHGIGNGNLLQFSCPENPMDRGDCWATVHGVAKSRT